MLARLKPAQMLTTSASPAVLERLAAGDQLGHRPPLGAAVVEAVDHRPAGDHGLRLDLALHRALEQLGALPGALVLVDMRVGAEGDQRAGIVGHLPR